MKKLLSFVLCFALLVAYVPGFASEFADVSGHWAEQDILELTQQGIIQGMSDTEFAPQREMTRAQFVALMNRAFPEAVEANSGSPNLEFADVRATDWYYNDVMSAVGSGLILGMDDGSFGASPPIRRQDSCVLLQRYIGDRIPNTPADASSITDYISIPDYAKQAVLIMMGSGIIKGYPDGAFSPLGNVTRAEVATMCKRSIDETASVTPIPTPSATPSPAPTNSGGGSGGGGGGNGGGETLNPTPTPAPETYVPPSAVPFDFIIEDFYDRLDGSTVTLPLSEKIVREKFPFIGYLTDYIIHNKTDQATKAVINGTKDVALVTYPADENLELASSKGVELAINPIVNDAFVFLVSDDVPVDGLTTQQVKDIYMGNITNWNQLPGCVYDKEIAVFSRQATSGSQKGMLDFMGDDAEDMIEVEEAMQPEAMNMLVDRMINTPGSIGYSYYYYVTEQYSSSLKLLSLDGVAPDSASISTNAYPVCVAYYAVYRADERATSFAYRFTQYLTSAEGQDYAEEIGYVRLADGQAVQPKSGNAAEKIYSTIPFSIKDLQEKTVRTVNETINVIGGAVPLHIDTYLNETYGLRLVARTQSTTYRTLAQALNLLVTDEKEVCIFSAFDDMVMWDIGGDFGPEPFPVCDLEELYPDLLFRVFNTEQADTEERSYIIVTKPGAEYDSFSESLYRWLLVEDPITFPDPTDDPGDDPIIINPDDPIIINPPVYKPIIYLYPTEETEITVTLGKPDELGSTYPKYNGAWHVLAQPNGDLLDLDTNRHLYSLYWEGGQVRTELDEGFCVKGGDSIAFLEEKLEILGLSEREANEFIIYWLPLMEANEYNCIKFLSRAEIDEIMPLTITPTPDSVIRVMMVFEGLSAPVDVREQQLERVTRSGFTVVEWGGTVLGGRAK
ncbi:MAG: S-layer homology domain-containing protein [Clostridiales bacterium]|jgi:ABC-type phosphate transport system substrate-binding protein|nr:S-layer homology domain-containing protein [Clostridiales bacterium]